MPNPDEFNILNGMQYKMLIHRLPNVTYWVQGALLPSVTLEGGIMPSPNRDIPVAGHKLEFEPINIRFILDEKLYGYAEIYHWMLECMQARLATEMVSDMTLQFLTGQMNVSRSVVFKNAYPMNLTELSVQSDDTDAIQVLGSVTFNYQWFEFQGDDVGIDIA